MPTVDRRTVTQEDAPLRLPWLAPALSWFPALLNLIPVTGYAVFVLAPWLVYFAGHGTGTCTVATSCDGPDHLQLPWLPGGGWDPLNWPLVVAGMLTLFVLVAGPVAQLVLGGLTVAGAAVGIFRHRRTTLAGGALMLALGLFQLTPTGDMITAWLLD